MFDHLAREWRQFRDDRSGHRFENRHRRGRRDGWSAAALVRFGLGVSLLLGGGVLLILPGPGLVVAGVGTALLASESRHVARGLDRIEPIARRWVSAARPWSSAR